MTYFTPHCLDKKIKVARLIFMPQAGVSFCHESLELMKSWHFYYNSNHGFTIGWSFCRTFILIDGTRCKIQLNQPPDDQYWVDFKQVDFWTSSWQRSQQPTYHSTVQPGSYHGSSWRFGTRLSGIQSDSFIPSVEQLLVDQSVKDQQECELLKTLQQVKNFLNP